MPLPDVQLRRAVDVVLQEGHSHVGLAFADP
jgi:hypothetical protein